MKIKRITGRQQRYHEGAPIDKAEPADGSLLSSRTADDFLRRIIPEIIQGATLDVSRRRRVHQDSAAHAIDVETAIEVWVPRRTTLLPYIPLRDDMITFTITFGLCPTQNAEFARDANLMGVFDVNRAPNNHSKLALNFAMDKFRARFSASLKATRKYLDNPDIDSVCRIGCVMISRMRRKRIGSRPTNGGLIRSN